MARGQRAGGAPKKPPNYQIDGRTFACQECKNGHRVGLCTHHEKRPLYRTNEPGRPAAGKQRRCQCPKRCGHSHKCRCDRDCSCTQKMYFIAFFDSNGRPVPTCGGKPEDGQGGAWEIVQTVTTDLKANILPPEEVDKRHRRRKSQTQNPESPLPAVTVQFQNRPPDPSNSLGSSEAAATVPDRDASDLPHTDDQLFPSNLDQVRPTVTVPQGSICGCGPSCNCAFCLEHPNNATSRRLVQQNAIHLSTQDVPTLFTPDQTVPSCTGAAPQFALFPGAFPSEADLQSLFPPSEQQRDGLFLAWPVQSSDFSVGPSTLTTYSDPVGSQIGGLPYRATAVGVHPQNCITSTISPLMVFSPSRPQVSTPSSIANETKPPNPASVGGTRNCCSDFAGPPTAAGELAATSHGRFPDALGYFDETTISSPNCQLSYFGTPTTGIHYQNSQDVGNPLVSPDSNFTLSLTDPEAVASSLYGESGLPDSELGLGQEDLVNEPPHRHGDYAGLAAEQPDW